MQRWQRFRVQLKGEAEPVLVQTTARDWANVRMDMGGDGVAGAGITFQVVHAALKREGVVTVPRDYDGFLDVLEAMPEAVDDDADDELLNPTGATHSDTPR